MLKILSICATLSFLLVSSAMAQSGVGACAADIKKSLRQHRTWKPPYCHLRKGACRRPFRRVQGKVGRGRGGRKNMPRGRREAMQYRTSAHPESDLHQ